MNPYESGADDGADIVEYRLRVLGAPMPGFTSGGRRAGVAAAQQCADAIRAGATGLEYENGEWSVTDLRAAIDAAKGESND